MKTLFAALLAPLLLLGCGSPHNHSAAPEANPAGDLLPSPEPGIGERVRFPSLDDEDGEPLLIDGYLFRPAVPGPHPAVVFLHGCGGLLTAGGAIDAREGEWARRLTEAGYVVLMVDSYSARGVRNMCAPDTYQAAVYHARPKDAYGALRYLQSQSFVRADSIGLIGWSMGGGTILLTIRDRDSLGRPADLPHGDFRAAVAFYPATCDARKLKSGWSTQVPLLVLVGDKDVWTPAAPCRALIDDAGSRGSPVGIQVYPGAFHDFDWPNLATRARPEYRTSAGIVPVVGMSPAARDDAFQRVPEFLAHYLGG